MVEQWGIRRIVAAPFNFLGRFSMCSCDCNRYSSAGRSRGVVAEVEAANPGWIEKDGREGERETRSIGYVWLSRSSEIPKCSFRTFADGMRRRCRGRMQVRVGANRGDSSEPERQRQPTEPVMQVCNSDSATRDLPDRMCCLVRSQFFCVFGHLTADAVFAKKGWWWWWWQ